MSVLGLIENSLKNILINIPQEKVSVTQSVNTPFVNRSSLLSTFFGLPEERKLDWIRQYSTELWVYICINIIAQSVSRIPIRVFKRKARKGTKGLTKKERDLAVNTYKVKLRPHDLMMDCYVDIKAISKFPIALLEKLDFIEEEVDGDLQKLIDKPNPFDVKFYLMEGSITYLELRGDSFIEMVGENEGLVSEINPPVELWHLNPDKIIVVPDPKEYIKGYVFDYGMGFLKIPKENMIHLKYFNPLDVYRGQSKIEPLTPTIRMSKNTREFQSQFFKQGMKPSAVISSPENLSTPQYNRLLASIEENYGGLRNMHRPLLLEGGLDWKAMSITQKDSEVIQFTKMDRENFLATYGVPPIMVGLPTENFATAKEATKKYYRDTVLPKVQLHEEHFNNRLTPLFGPDFFIKYDLSDTPLVQEDKKELMSALHTAFTDSALNRNEYRGNLFKAGLQLEGKINLGEKGEQFFITTNMINVDDMDVEDNETDEDEE